MHEVKGAVILRRSTSQVCAPQVAAPLAASGHGWVPATAIVGVVLGLIGLVYAQVSRVRARRKGGG